MSIKTKNDNLKEFGIMNRAANRYLECIYGYTDLPDYQVTEIKDAFLTGALSMLDAVLASSELSESEADDVLDLLDKEIEQFVASKLSADNSAPKH